MFAIGTAVILGPLKVINVLKVGKDVLDHQEMKKRISNLYYGVHLYKHKNNLWYFSVFLTRRLVFVAIPSLFFSLPFF